MSQPSQTLHATQLASPQQEAVLRALAREAATPGGRMLEVGSWCGHSTLILGEVAARHDALLYCVDSWQGSPDTALEGVAREHDVFQVFWRRVRQAGLQETIIPIRGYSAQVHDVLRPGRFDLVFLDGDHRYTGIREDILHYGPMAREGGILCGHDCEGRVGEFPREFLEAGKEKDYHETVHCGVVLAVGELLPQASINRSVWSVRRRDELWEPTDLDLPDDQANPSESSPPMAESEHYRVYRKHSTLYAVPRIHGMVNTVTLTAESFGGIVTGDSSAEIESKIGEPVRRYHPATVPGDRIEAEVVQDDFFRFAIINHDELYYAVARDLIHTREGGSLCEVRGLPELLHKGLAFQATSRTACENWVLRQELEGSAGAVGSDSARPRQTEDIQREDVVCPIDIPSRELERLEDFWRRLREQKDLAEPAGLISHRAPMAGAISKEPIQVAYRNEDCVSPKITLVLLDWSCRESFHLLYYLSHQSVLRSRFEVILIEYYDRRSGQVQEMLDLARQAGTAPPLDQWIILNCPGQTCYHKHVMYNVGIAAARAPIVSLMDSDAVVAQTFIQSILEHFERHPDSVLHLDQVRNARQDLYPFNYPPIPEILGRGCVNWNGSMTTGLADDGFPLLTRNYGACMCAPRQAMIEVGGADEDDDYLGHVCGPYDLTFRLVASGRQEHWLTDEFLYHTWHPGSDGKDNYVGPHDGYNNSVLALETLVSGRSSPRVENPLISRLRQSGLSRPADPEDLDAAIDAHRMSRWVLDEQKIHVARSRAAMNRGDWEKALEELTEAGGHRESPWALAEVGWVLRQSGRIEQSVEYFERAAMKGPGYHRIYSGLGWSLLQVGRLMEAVGAFEQAQARLIDGYRGDHDEILRGLAETWICLREPDKALECCGALRRLRLSAGEEDMEDVEAIEARARGAEARKPTEPVPGPMARTINRSRRFVQRLRRRWDRTKLSGRIRRRLARRAARRIPRASALKQYDGRRIASVAEDPSQDLMRRQIQAWYFLDPMEPRFEPDLDMLVLELPPRYQPMLPNGLGYLDSILRTSGLRYQISDLSIALYHRYHARRLGPGAESMDLPPGFSLEQDPWDNTFIHRWHEDEVADWFWEYMRDITRRIIRARPLVVGLSLNGGNRALARRMVRTLRESLPGTRIFVGGYDCVYDRTGRYLFTDYDYMFIKEAELTLVPVLRAVLRGEVPRDVPGVLSRYDTPGRPWTEPPLLRQLDACQWPRYEWTSLELYQNYRREHLIPISGSRGCAWGRCRFCAECFQYRGRDPRRIVDEISFFASRGLHTFHFNESDVNGDPQALYDVCTGLIERKLDLKLVGQLRIDRRNTAEYFRHLAKAGFTHLRFGVDGWSQHTLKLQCKGYAISRVKQNLRDCHAAGIRTTVNIVLGVPGETEEDIDAMVENLTELKDVIDQVEGINTLILAAGSDYFIHSDTHKIRFRGDKQEIFRKHPHYIPTELWYSEEPYIDQEVRLARMERLCTALYHNGVNIGPFAEMVVENLRKIGADPNIKVTSKVEAET